MKSKSKCAKEKESELEINKMDLEIKELKRLERLLMDQHKVESALKKCKGDLDKAEKILEEKWGKEKAKTMLERYHHFMDKDSEHPDSSKNIVTFLDGLKGFRNQIKKKSK